MESNIDYANCVSFVTAKQNNNYNISKTNIASNIYTWNAFSNTVYGEKR